MSKEESYQSTQAVSSVELSGHMTELAVRKTRETTDLMVGEVIPGLSLVLAHQKLTPKILMSIRNFYFKDSAVIGNSIDGIGAFSRNKIGENVGVIDRITEPIDEMGLRTVNVRSGRLFIHPEHSSLPEFVEPLVDGLNKFVEKSGRLSVEDTNVRLFKYYQAFSLLHPPPDGSGRFLGDMDTMVQLGIQKVTKKWSPHYISITGWRLGHHEKWAMEEDQHTRDYFVNGAWSKMNNLYPEIAGELERKMRKDSVQGIKIGQGFSTLLSKVA